MTWKIGIICAGDREIFKEHHTKDNNASLQGRIELGQEVGAPYCFTGYEHRRGGVFLICTVQQRQACRPLYEMPI